MAIKIVTDSTSDIPEELAKSLGITVVPLTVFFGEDAFKDKIEIQSDAFPDKSKILLVDDLIATGGTIIAAISLIERLGGIISSTAFIVDLPDLGGSQKIKDLGYNFFALTEFDGE